MANKMTKKDYFAILSTIVENAGVDNADELQAFIAHEVELLSKKSSKSGNSKKVAEQNSVMEEISVALGEFDKPVTVTELMTVLPYSNQKISAMLKKMVEDYKTVIKTVEKKKAYFSLNTSAKEVEEVTE